MSLSLLNDPEAVRSAIREYDQLGGEEFLRMYGYKPARSYVLVQDGREYPSKAIVGAAYGYQYPERGPLRSDEFSGGDSTVRAKLQELGFHVSDLGGSRSERVPQPGTNVHWFVGASFGGTNDQTERFLRDGGA